MFAFTGHLFYEKIDKLTVEQEFYVINNDLSHSPLSNFIYFWGIFTFGVVSEKSQMLQYNTYTSDINTEAYE